MANKPVSGSNISSVKPVITINVDKDVFAKQSIGNFWDYIDKSLNQNKFSWTDNIQNEINMIEAQTENCKQMLSVPIGKNIDLKC